MEYIVQFAFNFEDDAITDTLKRTAEKQVIK